MSYYPLLQLEESYKIPERQRILEFILRYPYTLPILSDMAEQLPLYFPNSLFVLDYTPHSSSPAITVSIVCDEPIETLKNRLDAFEEDWWIDELVGAKGRIHVSVW